MKLWLKSVILMVGFFSMRTWAIGVTLSESDYDSGRIYVPVRIDHFSGQIRLDTGATNSTLIKAPWNETFPTVDKSESFGADGGVSKCDIVQVNTIAVGAVGRRSYLVDRCEAGGDNLLGLDFFYNTVVFLDLKKPALEINPNLSNLPKRPLKIFKKLDTLLIGVALQLAGQNVYGILDTGADLTSVDSQFVARHPEMFEYVTETKAGFATGSTNKPKLYKLKNLQLGGQTLTGSFVLVYDFGPDLREFLGGEAPILIGFNVISKFNSWTIDLKNFTWDAN